MVACPARSTHARRRVRPVVIIARATPRITRTPATARATASAPLDSSPGGGTSATAVSRATTSPVAGTRTARGVLLSPCRLRTTRRQSRRVCVSRGTFGTRRRAAVTPVRPAPSTTASTTPTAGSATRFVPQEQTIEYKR